MQTGPSDQEVLAMLVERATFHNPNTGIYVPRLTAKGWTCISFLFITFETQAP